MLSNFQIKLLTFKSKLFLNVSIFQLKYNKFTLLNVYGHTMMNTPVLVRSRKLSIIGPG